MAGRKRVDGKKDGRGSGGNRDGRPPKDKTETILDALERAVKKYAKSLSTTWETEFAKLMFDTSASNRDRIAAYKLFMDAMIVKKQSKDVANPNMDGPAIRLPPVKADPAKVIPMTGKK